jgi:hypothetical protein
LQSSCSPERGGQLPALERGCKHFLAWPPRSLASN